MATFNTHSTRYTTILVLIVFHAFTSHHCEKKKKRGISQSTARTTQKKRKLNTPPHTSPP